MPSERGDGSHAGRVSRETSRGALAETMGVIPSGMEISGLEEEFELSRDLPRLLYAKVPAPDREPRLEHLIVRIGREASYGKFETSDQLERLLRDDLATVLSERDHRRGIGAARIAVVRGPRAPPARDPRSPRLLRRASACACGARAFRRLDLSLSVSGLLDLDDVAEGVRQLDQKVGNPFRLVIQM
jgi:hypothetical protein